MYAAAFAGVNATEPAPAPAPITLIQQPTSEQLVRAAFKENRVVIKKYSSRPII